MDEQVKIYGQIFVLGGEVEQNPIGRATTYLELIEQMDISEEQKQELREQYELIDLGQDPQKEIAFRAEFGKMLKEAEQKGMIERL